MIIALFVLERLKDLLESVDVDQFDESWDSEDTEELSQVATRDEEIEWKDRHKVNNKPARKVVLCNLFEIPFLYVGIRISVLTEETKNNIKIEVVLNDLIPNDMYLVRWLRESNIVHRCNTRIANKN